MNEQSIDHELQATAASIGLAVPDQAIQASQLEFWISVKATMLNQGYPAVQKRFPYISVELAKALSAAPAAAILDLCNPHMSTLKPALPDETIMQLLEPKQDTKSIAILQLISKPFENNEVMHAR